MEFLIVLLAVTAYMLPALVAALRGHPQIWAITALNLLLGLTGLGWIAALVWSLTAIPPGRRT
jgi:ABC-type transport system involved in cytochrome c biogenesis permease component